MSLPIFSSCSAVNGDFGGVVQRQQSLQSPKVMKRLRFKFEFAQRILRF
uniref:Uncharacterized protein n=1 Tax=Moniliophthora roreri TaxID=221103 RepID=A0A0W0EZM9_MONRR